MLNNILSLEGVAVLNKKQQRSISGGSCAYFNGSTGEITHNLSSQGAQGSLQNASDHWCCSSCNTASWYNAPPSIDNGGEYINGRWYDGIE